MPTTGSRTDWVNSSPRTGMTGHDCNVDSENRPATGPSGGHFPVRRMPANGNRRAARGGDPLGISPAAICRARAVLRLPGDRIFRRGGIRAGIEMVEEDLPAATLVGFAAVDEARKEVGRIETGRRRLATDEHRADGDVIHAEGSAGATRGILIL